jgi:hypothetical protein
MRATTDLRGLSLLLLLVILGGCGSATLKPDGGGADAGEDHSTGTGGTTGTGGATAGSGGSTSGTAGSGGSAAGTAGAGGATGGTGGAGGSGVPACTSTSSDSPAMTASNFCTIFLSGCAGVTGFTIPAGYTTMQMCTTSYAGLTVAQQMCRSYHVCNAISISAMTHCPHAGGAAPCN